MPVAGYRPYDAARAATYEARRVAQPEWAREWQIIVAAVGAMRPGDSVLDVPVGTGRFLSLYASRGLTVTGVDVSPAMLAQARRKHTAARLLEGDVTGDLARLIDGFVDFAVCLRLINWLTPREAELAFAQLLRTARRAVWVGLWTAETSGQSAASAETQAEADVYRWVATADWHVAERHVITADPYRLSAVWELRAGR